MDKLKSIRPRADMNAAGRGANLRRPWELDVLGPHLLHVLAVSGYDTLDKLRAASDDELLQVVGVDQAVLGVIREVTND